jgi:hypothetical protein
MKKTVTVKFSIEREKSFTGKYTGRLSCYVGDHEIVAESIEDLEASVNEFIERRSRESLIGLARSEKGNLYITRESVNGGVDTYTPNESEQTGVVALRCVSYSPSADIVEETELYAKHLVDSGQ